MAYIVDYAITENGAGGAASIVCNMPPHDPNDILLAIVAVNGSTTISMTAAAGTWAQIGTTQTANAGITSATFWLRADATDTETATVALGTADDYTIKIIAIKDCVTTGTPFNAQSSTNSGTATASQFNSVAITTTVADSLIIYVHALDGSVPQVHSDPGVHHLISSDATGTTANTSSHSSVSWYIQRSIGSTPTPGWTANALAVRTNHTIAFTNKAGGRIPAYIDDVTSPGTALYSGLHTIALNSLTITTPAFVSTAAINGKTTSASTPLLGADFGINSYSNALGRTGAVTAVNTLAGFQVFFTGNRNLSSGIVMGAVIAGNPKMGTFGLGSIAQGGFVVRLGSSATAWNAYQVAAKDTSVTTEGRYVFAIQPGYTGSTYGATQGTTVTTTAISHMQFLLNCPGFSTILYLSDLTQVFTQVIAGGDVNFPVDAEGLAQIGRSFRIPVIQKVGAAVLCFAPIQIGGGDQVYFSINAGAIQFPRRYNPDAKEIAYHAADNFAGISFGAKAGDSVVLTNSVITSPTPYRFEILNTATSEAAWDFGGTTIVNAAVTLRPVAIFDSMTFNALTSFASNASTIVGSIFSKCPQITASSGTFTNCEFSGSLVFVNQGALYITAATQAALQIELNKITGCVFSNNTGLLAAALRIIYTGTAGPISLSMSTNTFSGNTADIRWEAPAASNLTLNLSSVANPSTFTATNSNTVTFNNPKFFTIKNIITNSEVRIYRVSDGIELGGADIVSASPTEVTNVTVSFDLDIPGRFKVVYSYNYSVDVLINVVVYNVAYQPIFQTSTLKSTDGELLVTQISDRNYSNPA